jgi:uncharacterized caspase-like protein
VGVSRYESDEHNLNFCRADAEALASTFSSQKGRAFVDVQSRELTDERATTPNVQEGLRWLEQSCSPGDISVVLFSGHGVRAADGLYYFTHEGDPRALADTCLSWEEVAASLKRIRARQILFLSDCCHAGAFGERSATQDELAEALVKDAGVMVFASSRGTEKSLEKAEWGHGAFTLAVLDALKGQADLIEDGRITVGELQAYVANRVRKLTSDHQHPHIPRLENFDPELVIAYTE